MLLSTGRKLFFEDQLTDESLIHESYVESIQSEVGQVGYEMAQRSGMSAAKFATWCGKMVSGVGVPDLAVCSLEKFQVFDPVLLVEIAYFATLRTTYEKVIAYFDAVPRIQAALIIDVGYPWGRVGGAETSFSDPNHSKLVLVYLRRQPNDTVVAETVISFGNTPLTAADVERIVGVTGACDARPLSTCCHASNPSHGVTVGRCRSDGDRRCRRGPSVSTM